MRAWLCLVLLAACAPPPEARTVAVLEQPRGLVHVSELDTMRIARGAAQDQWTVSGFIERHLATVGLVRPGKPVEDTVTLFADLPTPGYALRARISPRPEQFCHLELDVIRRDTLAPVEKAPFWAVQAFDRVTRGIESLQPPSTTPIDDRRFARLEAQAAGLAKSGSDPPLSYEEYLHAPRPLHAGPPDEYYAPPSGPSVLAPQKP